MNYREAVAWLDSFDEFSMKLGLERVERFLRMAKLDFADLKVIHVAGSNGKGSVASMLARILRVEGYKVGLYTSPHLLDYPERIAVNCRPCTKKAFASLMSWARKIVDLMEERPMHFEVLTCAALKHFLDEKVDFLVCEVGLGGRLDATNVLNGLVNVITNISLEHTQILGDTLRQIASEKAGIIKFNSLAVTNAEGEALATIQRMARAKNAAVIRPRYELAESTDRGSTFDLLYPCKLSGLRVSLLGFHQVENAALAASAAYLLRKRGFPVSDRAIRLGLEKTFWPCRLQVISRRRRPLTLIDAGHNPDCLKRLSQSLKLFSFKQLFVVFGCYRDKDFREMLDYLSPKADTLILAKPKSWRAAETAELRPFSRARQTLQEATVSAAIEQAEKLAGRDDLLLLCGSLSVAREAMKHWKLKIRAVC